MKKVLALILSVAMVLSLATIFASAAEIRDFDPVADLDAQYVDFMYVNGVQYPEGQNACKVEGARDVDGSDGSITSVGFRGWFGSPEAATESFGYIIDDGDFVEVAGAKLEAEEAVVAAHGDARFDYSVDVTGLTDGETHKIQFCAKLTNGTIVRMNRMKKSDGSAYDRAAYVNYKAPAAATEGVSFHGASFDSLYVDDVLNFGENDGNASGKLDNHDRTVDGSDGSVSELLFRGWIGFDSELQAVGYKIGDAEPVFDESFLYVWSEAESVDQNAVQAEGNGGQYARRFQVTVPVADLTGDNNIVIVAKTLDQVLVLDDKLEVVGAATTPNTQLTYKGVAVATADASLVIFAVAAACVALVVLKKKVF